MNHVEDHITAYIHGEFSDEMRQKISNHLIDCASCQGIFKELKQTQNTLNLIEERVPSSVFSMMVMSKVLDLQAAEAEVDWVLEELEEMKDSPQSWAATFLNSQFPWYLVATVMLLAGIFFMHKQLDSDHRISETVVTINETLPSEMLSNLSPNVLPSIVPEPLESDEVKAMLEELGIDSNFEEELGELIEVNDREKIVDETFHYIFSEKNNKKSERFQVNNRKHIQLVMTEKEEKNKNQAAVNRHVPVQEFFKGMQPPVERLSLPANNVQGQNLKYWLYSQFNGDGSVGKGSSYHLTLNTMISTLILKRRYLNIPFTEASHYSEGDKVLLEQELIQSKIELATTYLKKISAKKGLGKNLYQHAQLTYFLCLLVAEGQNELESSLIEALDFLIGQQNLDGGWSKKFRLRKHQAFSNSNALVTGWAVLAMNEAKRVQSLKNKKNIPPSILKSHSFLNRIVDPRNGQCGFTTRGDGQHVPLCTVMATMARFSMKKSSQLKKTIKFTGDWVDAGIEHEKLTFPSQTDYDFIWFSKLFFKYLGDEEIWHQSTDILIPKLKEKLPKSCWGSLPKISRKLYLELITS